MSLATNVDPGPSFSPSKLTVEPLGIDHIGALYDFEIANRHFFESHINARPPDFYSRDGVAKSIRLALDDAVADRAYGYIVRTDANQVVARVNLTNVRRAHFHSAQLGYRVAESACGQGVASFSVATVLAEAFGPLRLVRLEATARPENVGSVRVLERNGFSQFGRSKRSVELFGEWFDLLHFDRRAP